MTVWMEVEGKARKVELPGAVSGVVECLVDGKGVVVDVRGLGAGVLSLIVGGRQYRCVLDVDAGGGGVLIGGRRFEFRVEDPRSLRGRKGAGAGTEGPRAVKAPMPGRVVRVMVGVGDEVGEGEGLVAIEAMKMQNELKAPKAGRVVRVAVAVGDTVGAGEVLVVVE